MKRVTTSAVVAASVFSLTLFAQDRQAPGKSIGTLSTHGDLIVLTLDENALGKANLLRDRYGPSRLDDRGGEVEQDLNLHSPAAWHRSSGGHRLDRLRALRYHHKLIFSVLIVCGILAVSDRGLAARLTRDFERDIRVSRKLDLDTWRRRPFLEKARELCWTSFGEVL